MPLRLVCSSVQLSSAQQIVATYLELTEDGEVGFPIRQVLDTLNHRSQAQGYCLRQLLIFPVSQLNPMHSPPEAQPEWCALEQIACNQVQKQ